MQQPSAEDLYARPEAGYLSLSPLLRRDPYILQAHLLEITRQPVLSPPARKMVVDRLLADVAADVPDAPWWGWDVSARQCALNTLKTLARNTQGAESIASAQSVRSLLVHSGLIPSNCSSQSRTQSPTMSPTISGLLLKSPRPAQDSSSIAASNVMSDVHKEALRCLANTLLLHVSTKAIACEMGAASGCLTLLENNNLTPDQHFLAARVLFLLTSLSSPSILLIVQEKNFVDILNTRLSVCLQRMTHGVVPPVAVCDLITDILKAIFNVTLFFPNLLTDSSKDASDMVAGEVVDERFAKLLPCLLRIVMDWPTGHLCTPVVQAVHSLLNFEVSAVWFSNPSLPSAGRGSALSRLSNALTNSPNANTSPRLSSAPNFKSEDIALGKRILSLIEATIHKYSPPGSDEGRVIQLCNRDNVVYDELLPPSMLLLRNIAASHSVSRDWLKSTLFPSNMDRSQGLERRQDLTGDFIRLMTSSAYTSTASSVGELLFTLSNSDGSALAAQIGYGNAAGFLFSRGLFSTPPPASDKTTREDIDPITGAYPAQSSDPLAGMTQAEKEAEAEKLFVLFDRLNRTGVMKVENPIRRAQEEGRFETVDDEDEKDRLDKQDIQDAQDVENELQSYKNRSSKGDSQDNAM